MKALSHLLLVLVGVATGAMAGLIGGIVLIDTMLGNPACEPDEGAGCGAAVVFLAVVIGMPTGMLAGGLTTNRLIRRRDRIS